MLVTAKIAASYPTLYSNTNVYRLLFVTPNKLNSVKFVILSQKYFICMLVSHRDW